MARHWGEVFVGAAVVGVNHFACGNVVASYPGAAGQRLSFGDCRTGCCTPEMTTPGAAGHIVGFQSYWAIANHSAHTPLIARHAERPTDRVTIHPGQGDTIVPFDIADILGTMGHVLTVLGAGPGKNYCATSCVGEWQVAWGLNPTTISYRVMITAVRPIIECSNDPLPTRAEVAERVGLTMHQLYDHLTHLCRLLKLTPPTDDRSGPWRLAALAEYAREHPYIAPTSS